MGSSVGALARAFAVAAALVAGAASASVPGVVISQVYGGNGNTYASDFVELFNAGTAPASLAGWSVQYASAAGTGHFSANGVTALSGTLQPGQYYLVRLSTTSGPALPTADATGTTNLSGTAGKVILANVSTGLACNGGSTPCSAAQLAQIVDLVGYGAANFFEGSAAAPGPGSTTAVVRALGGCTDTNDNGSDFTVGAPNPRNSATPPIACGGPQPVIAVCPATLNIATGATVGFALRASDEDSVVGSAALLPGAPAGLSLASFLAAPAIGGTASARLVLDGSTPAGSYVVGVSFGNDAGASGQCSIALNIAPVGSFTPVYTIQGSGSTSPFAGTTQTTRGVVTRVGNSGYFVQDAAGDGDPQTSDGLFVFTGSEPTVEVGQVVQVTGSVAEFNTGAATNATTLANPLTELAFPSATWFAGTGSIAPTPLALPVASHAELERLEGMLVQVTVPLTAAQNYFQGRYGQVTVAAGGRLFQPTQLHRPNSAQALALADLNARSALLLDDGQSIQNPDPTPYVGADDTLRAGDTLVAGLTGVIDYGLATNSNTGPAMYRLQPTQPVTFTRANPRTAAPDPVGGLVKVASFNVLNYFTTFTDGTNAAGQSGQVCTQGGSTPSASLCRGADGAAEFARQRTKIIEAMAAVNADVFGLMELQNNGNTAAQNLADGLNARLGPGTYAVLALPPDTGTDAIRVAIIYKPAVLSLAGAPQSDSNAVFSRVPIAQTFTLGNGERFSVVVNHFKSKGCDGASGADLDQGDGQGCFNARRVQQAQALLGFIATIQATSGDPDVLVIGDLNAYAQEDPVDTLRNGGLVDQAARFETNGYSYVFDGQSGSLDHALATPSLSTQVSGATHWHINADEPSVIDYNLEFKKPACAACGPDYYSPTPYRSSDHDPVVVGLQLAPPLLAQTISFATLPPRTLGDPPFVVTATATSGLAVSFASTTSTVCAATTGGSVTLLATGTCTIVASQAGDATYGAAAPVGRSFTVSAALLAQTIDFPVIGNRAVDAGPVVLAAVASSGLDVVYTSLTPATCTVAAGAATLLAPGTCTIAADQPGNATFAAATQVQRSFQVTAATGTADGDIPTLPEWAAILLGLTLLAVGSRRARPVRVHQE